MQKLAVLVAIALLACTGCAERYGAEPTNSQGGAETTTPSGLQENPGLPQSERPPNP